MECKLIPQLSWVQSYSMTVKSLEMASQSRHQTPKRHLGGTQASDDFNLISYFWFNLCSLILIVSQSQAYKLLFRFPTCFKTLYFILTIYSNIECVFYYTINILFYFKESIMRLLPYETVALRDCCLSRWLPYEMLPYDEKSHLLSKHFYFKTEYISLCLQTYYKNTFLRIES